MFLLIYVSELVAMDRDSCQIEFRYTFLSLCKNKKTILILVFLRIKHPAATVPTTRFQGAASFHIASYYSFQIEPGTALNHNV